jgi:hypothetical protein
LMLAHVTDVDRQLASDLSISLVRKTQHARLRPSLKTLLPSCHVFPTCS